MPCINLIISSLMPSFKRFINLLNEKETEIYIFILALKAFIKWTLFYWIALNLQFILLSSNISSSSSSYTFSKQKLYIYIYVYNYQLYLPILYIYINGPIFYLEKDMRLI